jgi:hypothetical protein
VFHRKRESIFLSHLSLHKHVHYSYFLLLAVSLSTARLLCFMTYIIGTHLSTCLICVNLPRVG